MADLNDFIEADDYDIEIKPHAVLLHYNGAADGGWRATRTIYGADVHKWLLEEAHLRERFAYSAAVDQIVNSGREAA